MKNIFLFAIASILLVSCQNQKTNKEQKDEIADFKKIGNLDSSNSDSLKNTTAFTLTGGSPFGGKFLPVSKTHIGYEINGEIQTKTRLLKDNDILYWYDGEELDEIDLTDIENLNLIEFKRVAGNIIIAADKTRIEDSFKE